MVPRRVVCAKSAAARMRSGAWARNLWPSAAEGPPIYFSKTDRSQEADVDGSGELDQAEFVERLGPFLLGRSGADSAAAAKDRHRPTQG